MLYGLDVQGRVCLWNREIERVTGYSREEIFGKSRPEFYVDFYPDPQVHARVLAEVTPGLYRDLETTITTADGGTRACAWTNLSARIQIPGLSVWGIGFDITDRKRAEAALRESEGRLRSLTEALPQLIWTSAPDGDCDYLNRQWVEYTGVADDVLRKDRCAAVLHPDDRDRITASWRDAGEGDIPFDLEHRIRGADGRYRWFQRAGCRYATSRAGSSNGSAPAPTSTTRSLPRRR